MTQEHKTITDDELQANEKAAEVYGSAREVGDERPIARIQYADYFAESRDDLDGDVWERLAYRVRGQFGVDLDWLADYDEDTR